MLEKSRSAVAFRRNRLDRFGRREAVEISRQRRSASRDRSERRAMMARATVVLTLVAIAACDEADVVDCGAGQRREVGSETYCVYAPGAVAEPSSVTCPSDVPVRVEIGDTVVCTTDRAATRPEDVPPDVCEGCGSNAGPPCGGGRMRCLAGCTDVATDADHCGACGAACAANERCVAGACVCDGDFSSCGPECVATATSRGHCGGCGVVCEAGFECCGGECVDLSTNARHCGWCGNSCRERQVCGAMSCLEDNDDCAAPRPLPVREGAASFDLLTGSRRPSGDGCGSSSDVFYSVELTRSALVMLTAESMDESHVAVLEGECGTSAAACVRDECAGPAAAWVGVLPTGTHRFVVGSDWDPESEPNLAVALRHLALPDGVVAGTITPPTTFALGGSTDLAADVPGSCSDAPDVAWILATCPSFAGASMTVTTCGATPPSVAATLSIVSADGATECGVLDMRCPMGSNVQMELPPGAGLYAVLAELPAGVSGTVNVYGTFD